MAVNKVEIKSRDFWIKVVDMLQQNWALIDELPDGGVIIFSSLMDPRCLTNRNSIHPKRQFKLSAAMGLADI